MGESLRHPRAAAATTLENTGSVLRVAGTAAQKAVAVANVLASRRSAHGGTVNDVILATITGALRAWLITRGESTTGSRQVRAIVSMSVIDNAVEPRSLGSAVTGHLLGLPGHALAIGVTSYDGGVYFGINADFDALPDVDVFGQCVEEALDELVESASENRQRAPRGRRSASSKSRKSQAT
ncbi:MAG: WSD1 family O-acyltransferase [Actinomycetota bacterium]|nr:WSD1 family O-acyltransferase [Actinomycetota bacterium]